MQKIALPEWIDADRIFLKRHSIDLAEEMFRYVDRDRARLRRFMPWVDDTRTIEDEKEYLRMTEERWNLHELFDYGIFRKSDSVYLGNCGVHSIAWQHSRCELGYWIFGEFEGKGFVSEAVRALESTLFTAGFHRIEIHCSSSNLRSARVPRANGYRLECVQREDAVENGRWRDTLVFAKLRSEHLARKPHHPLIGLDHARLSVRDLAESKKWYARVLGAKPELDLPAYAEFRIGTNALALAPEDEKSPHSAGGQVVYWRVHELPPAIKHFTREGAQVYRGPLAIENGEAICQIMDPFGNVIGLIGRA